MSTRPIQGLALGKLCRRPHRRRRRPELDPFWTLDGSLTWEPLDKRFELDLAAYNLLDEDFQVAANTPGWGRTIVGTLKVRF